MYDRELFISAENAPGGDNHMHGVLSHRYEYPVTCSITIDLAHMYAEKLLTVGTLIISQSQPKKLFSARHFA